MKPQHVGPRLFVEDELRAGAALTLGTAQAHYLRNVMRRAAGDTVIVFNGRDGEWRADLIAVGKKAVQARPTVRLRRQTGEPDVWLLFAPLKKTATDFLVEKAVELGVSTLLPVTTDKTNSGRINADRLGALICEAAEQCERLSVPRIDNLRRLRDVLADWPADRLLLVADETDASPPAVEVMQNITDRSVVFLIGPEGGFSAAELDDLRARPFVLGLGLGPCILRAETAATVALACWQAISGDGRQSPPSRQDL